MNKNIQRVVEFIQSHIADGELVWHKPYICASHANVVSKKAYQGINRLTTALIGHQRGYSSPYWATYQQIATLGGTLVEAKGQGIPILFYKQVAMDRDDEDNREADHQRHPYAVLRQSRVFNLDLVEGMKGVEGIRQDSDNIPFGLHDESEGLIKSYVEREGIRLSTRPSSTPAYAPAIDTVFSPGVQQFCPQDKYYSALFHELAHSSGHPKRLARFKLDQVAFERKEDYSKEELVAEFSAAMLCHRCDVDSQASIENSAAYIQGWSRFINDHAQTFVQAVKQAYQAYDFICERTVK